MRGNSTMEVFGLILHWIVKSWAANRTLALTVAAAAHSSRTLVVLNASCKQPFPLFSQLHPQWLIVLFIYHCIGAGRRHPLTNHIGIRNLTTPVCFRLLAEAGDGELHSDSTLPLIADGERVWMPSRVRLKLTLLSQTEANEISGDEGPIEVRVLFR